MMSGNALVTGSTSGLGLVIAKELVKNNYRVMLHGRIDKTDGIEKLYSEFSNMDYIAGYDDSDVSDKNQVAQLLQRAENSMGRIDILVNNAGIQYVADMVDFPDDKWDAIIAINLSAYFHSIKHALEGMRNRNYGRIINIASTHGLVASHGKSAYVASKHGVVGLTKVVALENAGFNITCNAICPGFVLTPLVDKQIADEAKSNSRSIEEERERFVLQKHPNGRFVNEQEVADTVLFLIKQQSMTGSSVVIDGGWTAI